MRIVVVGTGWRDLTRHVERYVRGDVFVALRRRENMSGDHR
jgi:hypothetical protein